MAGKLQLLNDPNSLYRGYKLKGFLDLKRPKITQHKESSEELQIEKVVTKKQPPKKL